MGGSLSFEGLESVENYYSKPKGEEEIDHHYSKCYKCNSKSHLLSLGSYVFCETCYHREMNEMKEYGEKCEMETSEIDQITEKVYLGNMCGSKDKQQLQKIGITHILVCGVFLPKFYPDDFKYKSILIEDSFEENIEKYFKECIQFINSADKVFVHCRAGISRSSSMVIAYLMWKEKMQYDKARKFVQDKRPIVCPNLAFEKQLKSFCDNLGKNNYKL